MVEINNQRKAFLHYWQCVGGTDNGHQAEIMVIMLTGGGYLQVLDHPHANITLNPKLKSTGADAGFFPVGGMPTASSLA